MTFATLYYYIFDDHILLFHVQHNKLYLHQKQKLKNKTALRGGLIAYITISTRQPLCIYKHFNIITTQKRTYLKNCPIFQ